MTKIKVVDLKKLYDFLVDNFLFEIFCQWKIILVDFTFEIRIWQTTSDGLMTKTKVVHLKALCNFVINNTFI